MRLMGFNIQDSVIIGGYNGTVAPEYGSAVFVMDLENEGKLLKEIDIKDEVNKMHNYIFGTVHSVGER